MATEIKNQCPLILFEYNSQVIRAVSQGADAGGPYTKVCLQGALKDGLALFARLIPLTA